jgi:NADH-quinone oxidoreductase subunit J
MTVSQILFLVIAIISLIAAIRVVTARNLIHAALWLVVTLFGVGLMFASLNAGFLAVAQVVIYIGAIAILFIFIVMLTRAATNQGTSQINTNWSWGALISLVLFAVLIWVLAGWSGFTSTPPPMDPQVNTVAELGIALVAPNGYLLPFEVASILLLAALIGAIMIASAKK